MKKQIVEIFRLNGILNNLYLHNQNIQENMLKKRMIWYESM